MVSHLCFIVGSDMAIKSAFPGNLCLYLSTLTLHFVHTEKTPLNIQTHLVCIRLMEM